MNNLKKSHDLVRQNEKNVQKSQKHDANLQKNSTLYFQVGLILCLLASYGALEMSFATGASSFEDSKQEVKEDYVYVMPDFEIIKETKPEKKQDVKKSKSPEPDIEIVDDNTKVVEPIDTIVTQVVPDDNKKIIISTDDPSLKIPDPVMPLNIMAVQRVPVFPGCERETNNDGRRKCLANKLTKLVQRKFDVDVASGLGLSGKQKIYVSFKINKVGEVVIIDTKANHKDLEKEAKRVVGKIPTMEPGKNNNKPVEVSYMLPIQFNIL